MRIFHSPLHALHDGGMELHRGELVPSFETPSAKAPMARIIRKTGSETVI